MSISAFGSMQDEAPYHGLLFAFSTQTLQQQEVLNVTTTGSEGGILDGRRGTRPWMRMAIFISPRGMARSTAQQLRRSSF